MPLSERLRNEWRKRARSCPFAPTMALTDEGLVLGAGTVLAKSCSAGGNCELSLLGAEERIIALLSVAHGRAIDPSVLGNVRRASAAQRDGESVIASIHLARAGLPSLDEDAGYRLFAADRLLASGIDTRVLLKACDIDTAIVDLLKGFNPDEPRVPAGNPGGGEWTDGGDASAPTIAGPSGHGSNAPIGYTRVGGLPADAKAATPADGISVPDPDSATGKLMAPPHADFREVYAAGRRIASDPLPFQIAQIGASLAQGGLYDFQRDAIRQEVYPAYANASNYAVGVYMAGAGFPLFYTLRMAETYALFHSSNYGGRGQRAWTIKGWKDAEAGRWKK